MWAALHGSAQASALQVSVLHAVALQVSQGGAALHGASHALAAHGAGAAWKSRCWTGLVVQAEQGAGAGAAQVLHGAGAVVHALHAARAGVWLWTCLRASQAQLGAAQVAHGAGAGAEQVLHGAGAEHVLHGAGVGAAQVVQAGATGAWTRACFTTSHALHGAGFAQVAQCGAEVQPQGTLTTMSLHPLPGSQHGWKSSLQPLHGVLGALHVLHAAAA